MSIQAGQPILAADVLAILDSLSVVEHDILSLYIQMYYDAKNPEYLGLFFDGFGDTTKQDTGINTTLTAAAAVDDTTIDVGAFESTELNKEFDIYSGTKRETVKATAVADTEASLFADDFDRADSETVGNGWDEGDSWAAKHKVHLKTNAVEFEQLADQNGGVTSKAYRTETTHAGVTIKADVFFDCGFDSNGDNAEMNLWIGVGADTSWGEGNGVFFHKAGNSSNQGKTTSAMNIAIMAGGQDKAWTVFETGLSYTSDWGSEADPYKVEVVIGADLHSGGDTIDLYVWRSSGSKPSTPTLSWTGSASKEGDEYKIQGEQYAGSDGNKMRVLDFEVVQTAKRLTITPALDNAYAVGDDVKRSTAQIDTSNKKLKMQASIGDGKQQSYYSDKQVIQGDLRTAKIWVARNFTAQFNHDIAPSGTTVQLDGDKTSKFAVNDVVDISNVANTSRERRTISAIDYNTTTTGKTTITLNTALTGTYTTSDFIERVDAMPSLSYVATGGNESFDAVTYVRSELLSATEVEDEYKITASAEVHDLILKLLLSREDTTLVPEAKRPAVSLTP